MQIPGQKLRRSHTTHALGGGWVGVANLKSEAHAKQQHTRSARSGAPLTHTLSALAYRECPFSRESFKESERESERTPHFHGKRLSQFAFGPRFLLYLKLKSSLPVFCLDVRARVLMLPRTFLPPRLILLHSLLAAAQICT
jgi:hypothetical protein